MKGPTQAVRASHRPTAPPQPTHAYLTGSRIVATTNGALVIDADSGLLVAANSDGKPIDQAMIGRNAGQLVLDPVRDVVFVADRMSDRIALVDHMKVIAKWPTPAEPFGVALTPDRSTLLVTTIADRTLVALDATNGAEKWRVALSPEARGISISPDGTRALVSSLAVGSLDVIDLASHARTSITYDLSCESCSFSDPVARGTGAVQFLDAHRAVAGFQRSIPSALTEQHTGVYGGGVDPPITQHVAFLTFGENKIDQAVAQIADNQPRSFAWNGDTLTIAGHGSDTMLQLPGLSGASNDSVENAASNVILRSKSRCGPDGLATGDGELWIWCALSRTIERRIADELLEGPVVAASSWSEEQHRGLVLFYATTSAINRDRALACASCHLDGRADGLSWRIGGQPLQTPILAGRIADTAPYKWQGTDVTLVASLMTTIKRLGGFGLDAKQGAAVRAYLQALPPPRAPTRDVAAIARGKLVFERDCDDCHKGARYTDGTRHQFESTLVDADTPSLVGLSASAPYYHDGSARTLDDLVNGRGAVREMAKFEALTAAERADLLVFLESL